MKIKGARYETCGVCGREWNVSINAKVKNGGYICPWCSIKNFGSKAKGKLKKYKSFIEYALVSAAGIILCKYEVEYAFKERGYFAFGGEWLILLLPVWWFMYKDVITGTVKMVREVFTAADTTEENEEEITL